MASRIDGLIDVDFVLFNWICRILPASIASVAHCLVIRYSLANSAARKVVKKVANLLLKVAQKVGTLKNQFKTSLKPVLTTFLS